MRTAALLLLGVTLTFIQYSGSSTWISLELIVLDGKYSHAKAKIKCKEKEMELYFPNDGVSESRFVELMRLKNVNSVWIAAERRQLRDWQWVDNSTFCPPPTKNTQQVEFTKETNERCAVFDVKSGNLKPCFCFESRICHICNLKACDYSEGGERKCIRQGQSFFVIIGHTLKSWFIARQHCQMSGGDLAKTDTRNKLQDINDKIFERTENIGTKCKGLYVGLRLDHWVYVNGHSREEIPVPDLAWETGEPSNEHCAELVLREDNTTRLRAKDCITPNHVLCIASAEGKANVQESTVQKECKNECKEGSSVPVKVSLAVVSVALPVSLAATAIFVIKRMREKKTDKVKKKKNIEHTEMLRNNNGGSGGNGCGEGERGKEGNMLIEQADP